MQDLGLGLGLRASLIADVLERQPEIDFFEIMSEDYLGQEGRAIEALERIAARYPLLMHGVSLSIGSTDPLDLDYLAKLRALADRIGARGVSDHVCWTSIGAVDTHDLLPLPLTEAALRHVIGRVRIAQDALGRQLILENPSTYLEFRTSSMSEWEFIGRLAEAADCRILLDVNNVYVSARNHGFDPFLYIDSISRGLVAQIHLGGHQDLGTHLLDTHDQNVSDVVWELYEHAIGRFGLISTSLEWDTEIPPLAELQAELSRAATFRTQASTQSPTQRQGENRHRQHVSADGPELSAILRIVHAAILRGDVREPSDLLTERSRAMDGLQIHATAYRARHVESLRCSYPLLGEILGDDFDDIARQYLRQCPPPRPSLRLFEDRFASWLLEQWSPGAPWAGVVADVAAFESSLRSVWNASASGFSEASSGVLRTLPLEELAQIHIAVSPCLRLLEIEYACYLPELARARSDIRWSGRPNRHLAIDRGQGAIRVVFLHQTEFRMLHFLSQGASLGEALEDAAQLAAAREWCCLWAERGVLALGAA